MVASVTGIQIPRNKAIVGENAFAHEAGIHQHGMLQHSSTYEIMKPEGHWHQQIQSCARNKWKTRLQKES